MKLAVLSDIHANLNALEAVLEDARNRGAEKFLCLGDIVGYGPQPEECVQSIQSLGAPTVIGNHDAWAVRPVALSRLAVSPTTVPGLQLARLQLSDACKLWLRELPYTVQQWSVSGVHGSFHRPEKWSYLSSPEATRASLLRQPTAIAFFGHTHEPGFWSEGGERFITPTPNRPYRLGPDRRYVLNPGSVGNPRTPAHRSDPRAQYLLFDSDNLSVIFVRVDYDVQATIAAMKDAGLPDEMMSRMELGY
jgi:predicted phosphodiesterase